MSLVGIYPFQGPFCVGQILKLVSFLSQGSSQARQERSRRNVGISKEGICPAWSVLRNCSLSSTCKKDNECSDKQKCCEDACGHHACFEAVLPLTADEGERTNRAILFAVFLTLSLPSSKSTFSRPFGEICTSEVVRIGSIFIFHLSRL